MPRLQVSKRPSLLATNLRDPFLQALNRNVTASVHDLSLVGRAGPSNILTLARRVQADFNQTTGRYSPLHQIVASIRDLKPIPLQQPQRQIPQRVSTPRPLRIIVTSTTPESSSIEPSILPPSMSRRRIAHNIPTLQCHLPIRPVLSSPITPPDCETSSSLTPTCGFASIILNRRPSSCGSCPITPTDQILHTPLSPPRMPRAFPAPPRSWARLNAQARKGETSPLVESPVQPSTPYLLGPNPKEKPFLSRLHIPNACTLAVRDRELQRYHLSSTASPQTLSPILSPFDLGKASAAMEPCQSVAESRRPMPVRTNSSSSLTRTALLRASRPARRFSLNQGEQVGAPRSPLSPFASAHVLNSPLSPMTGQPLASPFLIRPEAVAGDYFHV